MRNTTRLMSVAAILVGLTVAGCGKASEFDNEAASDAGPSKLEPVKGSDLPRVVLTPQAARRIGIRTSVVPLWMRDPATSAQLAADALAAAAR